MAKTIKKRIAARGRKPSIFVPVTPVSVAKADPVIPVPKPGSGVPYAAPDQGTSPQAITTGINPYKELGRSGLNQVGGYLQEEFRRELQGQLGMRKYREMMDNWSLIDGILKTIKLMIRQAQTHVEPFSKASEDIKLAEFVKGSLDDMSHTWADTVTEILSMVGFGYAPMEIVYKKREGYKEGGESSKYSDGLIGWRKWALRGQESVTRWGFDESGGVAWLIQQPAPTYEEILIPIQKLLLFRTEVTKGNPEGRSWLRGAYFDWLLYKRLVELAAIRVERDSTGIPVMSIPAENMVANSSTGRAEVLDAARDIVENLRNDEQAGVVLPQRYDPETKMPLFDLKLLGSPGQPTSEVNALIQRHMQNAAISLLADFVLLGHEKAGSWALADNKTGLFAVAIGGLLESIAAVINRHAIPRLWALNGLPMERMPQLKFGDLEKRDLAQLSAFLQGLASAGMVVFPNPELEEYIFEEAGLPKPVHDPSLYEGKEEGRKKPEAEGEMMGDEKTEGNGENGDGEEESKGQ